MVDHHVSVSVNGVLAGEASFSGKRPYRMEVAGTGVGTARGDERDHGGERGGHGGQLSGVPGPLHGELPAAVGGEGGDLRGRDPGGRDGGGWGPRRPGGGSGRDGRRRRPVAAKEVAGIGFEVADRRRSSSRLGAVPGGGGAPLPRRLGRGRSRAAGGASGALDAAQCGEPGGLPADRAAELPLGGGAASREAGEPGAEREGGVARGDRDGVRSRSALGGGDPQLRVARVSPVAGPVPAVRGAARGRDHRPAALRGDVVGVAACRRCGGRRATCGRRWTRRSRR